MIDAIIPAHNEESTVGAVVGAALRSTAFEQVIVVNDGSTDRTAQEARRAGAQVVSLVANRGKAAAMLTGLAASSAPSIAFFDADAVGLEASHVRLLVDHFCMGFTQVCGIQDHGILNPLYGLAFPVFTGQRIVRRSVLEKLPVSCQGYSVEAAINCLVDAEGGSTCVVFLRGASFRDKTAKLGLLRGLARNLGMWREINAAAAALRATNGAACTLKEEG